MPRRWPKNVPQANVVSKEEELQKENEILRKENELLKGTIDHYEKVIARLEHNVELWKQIAQDYCDILKEKDLDS